jgi:exopolysaccharide biosynthesis polyprenyl glycosylphosphotransferase
VDRHDVRWARFGIFLTDAIVLTITTLVAFQLRFDALDTPSELAGPIQIVGTLTPLLWIVMLVISGAYDRRAIGLGLSEYGRVIQSSVLVLIVISLVSFLGKFDTSRGYVLAAIPLGLAALLIERWIWRRVILRWRREGRGLKPTIIVGDAGDQAALAEALEERPWAGYQVVGFVPAPSQAHDTSESTSSRWLDELIDTVYLTGAQCVAMTASAGVNSAVVREVSWRIEGMGLDLLISSKLGAVTGPRITLRVATGLPLLHLDEVSLRTTQRIAKRMIDVAGSAIGLIVLSPILLIISMIIAVSSGPPVFYRQRRAGLDGKPFEIWKFRTMRRDADSLRDQLREESQANGPILKIVNDPRVTPFGRFLRRWSLDELPQLLNVLGGSMSLVGPRPHPFDDVEEYDSRDYRRLIAKPGMTGLWQVAGRSDLSWDDAIELDLLYIENWSFIGDIAILARTVQAVVSRSGAY